MSKKLIAALLICSVMLSVFAVPSSAIATETLLIGGTIAAFLAACGVAVTSPGMDSDGLAKILYDQWKDRQAEWDEMTDIDFISLVSTKNNKIVLDSRLSAALSSFTDSVKGYANTQGLVWTADGTKIDLPVIHENDTYIVYRPKYSSDFVFNIQDTNKSYWKDVQCKWVSQGIASTPAYNFYQYGNLSYPIVTSYSNNHFTATLYPENHEDSYMLAELRMNNGQRLVATITSRTASYPNNFRQLIVCGVLPNAYWENNKDTEIGFPLSLPSDTLEDDEETVIDIGIPVTSVSDAAEKALTSTLDGTISATYTNTNPVPPVPDTNLSFVKGLHSIWYYVEYLISHAAAGMQFFTGLLASLPTEITYLFYGAFVLMLFGGIISRLLL